MTAETPLGQVLVVTGTSTDVGKTVTVAALASAAAADGLRVAVCKPAQTGVGPDDPGDLETVVELAGEIRTAEVVRYREPLAPETAARRSGQPFARIDDICATVEQLRGEADLVLVEGAGGVLVRLAPDLTLIDVAAALDAPVVVVTDPGLGTLNHTELTVDALRAGGCEVAGLVLGSWPQKPDLATACNADDLPRLTGVPVVAVVPAGAGRLARPDFRSGAPAWLRGSRLWARDTVAVRAAPVVDRAASDSDRASLVDRAASDSDRAASLVDRAASLVDRAESRSPLTRSAPMQKETP